MGHKCQETPSTKTDLTQLEAWALTHTPRFLDDIDAAEAQIAAGTMTPVDEIFDEEKHIKAFAEGEAYGDDPLRSTMDVQLGHLECVWELIAALERTLISDSVEVIVPTAADIRANFLALLGEEVVLQIEEIAATSQTEEELFAALLALGQGLDENKERALGERLAALILAPAELPQAKVSPSGVSGSTKVVARLRGGKASHGAKLPAK